MENIYTATNDFFTPDGEPPTRMEICGPAGHVVIALGGNTEQVAQRLVDLLNDEATS